MEYKMKIIFIFLIYFYYHLARASHTNFKMIQFKLCNNTQGVIKYHGNITTERGKQYITHEVITPVDFGFNLGVTCTIESLISKNNYVELFTIKEKNICLAARTYLGEFWYDLVRASGVVNSKSCPIPAGRYQVQHFQLEYHKIALQTFPFGKLRFTIKAINNKHPEIDMLCFLVVVDNSYSD